MVKFWGLPMPHQHTILYARSDHQVAVAMPAIRAIGTARLQKKIGIDQVANHPIRHQKAA